VIDAFPPGTLDFLTELRENNTHDWFDAHRGRYQRDVLAPAKELVTALGPALERLAPGIRAEPRVLGSIFRINRDTRFSADKRPYKDHLDFWFWHGDRAAAVSGLYLRLSPDGLAVGGGAHDLRKETLRRYRAAVCDPSAGAALVDITRTLEGGGSPVLGRSLSRPPAGFGASPDATPLLLHGALFAARLEPPDLAMQPDLVTRLVEHWAPLAPLHLWLVRHRPGGLTSAPTQQSAQRWCSLHPGMLQPCPQLWAGSERPQTSS
jgi:uncharacterized protein (TIGR02453 family)